MKISIKILLLFAIVVTMLSCTSPADDIKYDGFEYVVVDTTSISKNGFDTVLGYNVIIQMDSAYYSAYMSRDGIIRSIDRKLRLKP